MSGHGCYLCDAVFNKFALWKIAIRRVMIQFHNNEGHNKRNWVNCEQEPCKSICAILENTPDIKDVQVDSSSPKSSLL